MRQGIGSGTGGRGALVVAGVLVAVACQRRPSVAVGGWEPERKSSAAQVKPRDGSVDGSVDGGVGAIRVGAGTGTEDRGALGAENAAAPVAHDPPPPAPWGAATDLLVYVTLDVPGRLPAGAVLRVDLADASELHVPAPVLASRELVVSHGDRLQVSLSVPTGALRRASRLALSARVEGRHGKGLLAITTVPLLLTPPQLGSRLELWVRALPPYEAAPKYESWLPSPDQIIHSDESQP